MNSFLAKCIRYCTIIMCMTLLLFQQEAFGSGVARSVFKDMFENMFKSANLSDAVRGAINKSIDTSLEHSLDATLQAATAATKEMTGVSDKAAIEALNKFTKRIETAKTNVATFKPEPKLELELRDRFNFTNSVKPEEVIKRFTAEAEEVFGKELKQATEDLEAAAKNLEKRGAEVGGAEGKTLTDQAAKLRNKIETINETIKNKEAALIKWQKSANTEFSEIQKIPREQRLKSDSAQAESSAKSDAMTTRPGQAHEGDLFTTYNEKFTENLREYVRERRLDLTDEEISKMSEKELIAKGEINYDMINKARLKSVFNMKFWNSGLTGTFLAGFVFMFSSWIMSRIEKTQMHTAALASVATPQYFGGLWLRIPDELINLADPMHSIPVYARVANPGSGFSTPNLFQASWGFFGQSDESQLKAINKALFGDKKFLGISGFETNGENADDYLDLHDLYVTAGGNRGGYCGQFGWGDELTISPYWGRRMLGLNTGYEFWATGRSIDNKYPMRQLLGDSLRISDCETSVENYIKNFLAGIVYGGEQAGVEWDMFNHNGSFYSSGGSEKSEKTQGFTNNYILKNGTEYTLLDLPAGKTLASLSEADLKSLAADSPKGMLNNAIASFAGKYNLTQVKEIENGPWGRLFGSLAKPKERTSAMPQPLSGYGHCIYQTSNTNFIQDVRTILNKDKDSIVDYVVPLMNASADSVAPAIIPNLTDHSAGVPVTLKWGIANPAINYLYSLVSKKLINLENGTERLMTGSFDDSVKQNPLVEKALGSEAQPTMLGLQLKGMQKLLENAFKGTFKYLGYTLEQVPVKASVYKISNGHTDKDPVGPNGAPLGTTKTTLEVRGTIVDGILQYDAKGTTYYLDDYIVPVNENLEAVSIEKPEAVYFVSLVTSQIYEKNIDGDKPTTLGLSTKPIDFVVAESNGGTTVLPADQLSGQSDLKAVFKGQSKLGTLYTPWNVNPYNKDKFGLSTLLNQLIMQLPNKLGQVPGMENLTVDQRKAIAAAFAYQIINAIVLMGQTSKKTLGTINSMNSNELAGFAASIIDRVLGAIKEMPLQPNYWQQKLSATTLVQRLLKDAKLPKNDQITFQGKKDDILNTITDASYLATPQGLASFYGDLAEQGFIPLQPMFLYRTRAQLSSTYDEKSGSLSGGQDPLSTTLKWDNNKDLVTQSYLDYFEYLRPSGADFVAATLPMAFTDNLIPNVILTPFNEDYFKRGFYIYSCNMFTPGDNFVVVSKLENLVPEAFDITNRQPYLISLSSGTVYQRDENGDIVIQDKPIATDPILKQISGKLGGAAVIKDLALSIQGSFRNYAGRILYLDQRDEQANLYVYQDVTNASKGFKRGKDTFEDVSDFMVGASLSSGTISGPVILSDKPELLISLVTGIAYDQSGAVAKDQPDYKKALPINFFSKNLKNLRLPLKNEIARRAQTYQGEQAAKAEKPLAIPQFAGKQYMDAQYKTDSSGITIYTTQSPIPPFDNLYVSGSGYYGFVKDAANKEPFGYAQFNYQPTNIPQGMTTEGSCGIGYFDLDGNLMSAVYGENARYIRMMAGLYNIGGCALTIGVPQLVAPMNWTVPSEAKNIKFNAQLVTGEKVANSKIKYDGIYPGSYDISIITYPFSKTTSAVGSGAIATYKPVHPTGAPSYYVEMSSGNMFDMQKNPIIGRYPVLKTGNGITSIAHDLSGNPRVFARADNGYYYDAEYDKNTNDGLTLNSITADNKTLSAYHFLSGEQSFDVSLVGDVSTGLPYLNAFGTVYVQSSTTGTPVKYSYAQDSVMLHAKYIGSRPGVDFEAQPKEFDSTCVTNAVAAYAFGPTATELFIQNTTAKVDGAATIYVPSLILDPNNVTEHSFVKCNKQTGNAYQLDKAIKLDAQVKMYTLTQDLDQQQITYVVLVCKTKDQNAKDVTTAHYYMIMNQVIDTLTLNCIQDAAQIYTVTNANGDTALVRPIRKDLLKSVEAILGIPANDTNAMDRMKVVKDALFNQREGTPTDKINYSNRYFYQFGDGETIPGYPSARYVDIASGIMFDSRGTDESLFMPIATLAHADLKTFQKDKGIRAPDALRPKETKEANPTLTPGTKNIPEKIALTGTLSYVYCIIPKEQPSESGSSSSSSDEGSASKSSSSSSSEGKSSGSDTDWSWLKDPDAKP